MLLDQQLLELLDVRGCGGQAPVRMQMMQRKTCAMPCRKTSTPATTITVLNWKIGMFAGLMVLTSR